MSDEIDASARYPLAEQSPGELRSRTGLPFDKITLDAVCGGAIAPDDLTIAGSTLQQQSAVAAQAGYRQLAENLRRASELVEIPNERLLQIYEALRPRRSTYAELLALADDLQSSHGAEVNARFIRQAAEAYRSGGLLRDEGAP